MSFAKGKFDELAKKCGPLKEGCDQEGIKFHNQPNTPADVEDDGVFRLIVLGADYAGQPGAKPHTGAEAFLEATRLCCDKPGSKDPLPELVRAGS